jgi:hypothetical protein
MSPDQGPRESPSASPVREEPQPLSRECFGLKCWALLGFAVWLPIMVYLKSLEGQLPTGWVRLGLPLLAPYTRSIADWRPTEKEILHWGLLVDDLNLLLYPVVFWSFLKSIALWRQRAGKCCAPCFRQASHLALLAMPFDWIENVCLHLLVMGETEPSGGLLRLLTVVSLLKLACVWVVGCWLGLGSMMALWSLWGRRVWPASPDSGSGGSTPSGQVARRDPSTSSRGETS